MKNKEIFNKAYSRLSELYAGEEHVPSVKTISRFYEEKMILEDNSQYLRCLEFCGRLREAAERKGEHIFVRGTTGSSFIAYLLGATNVNPLPPHEYCPKCRSIRFIGAGSPFDKATKKCLCGSDITFDGHDIPFASNIKYGIKGHIQISVSYEFLDEAKQMISEEDWGKTVVKLTNGGLAPTWFCFLDNNEDEKSEYCLTENSERFERFVRITLVADKGLGRFRELERATGYKVRDIDHSKTGLVFFEFMERNIKGIKPFDNEFMLEIWDKVSPQSYDDLLKLIGFAHSTNVWRDNAERLFADHRMTLRDIPAYRDDIYAMIVEKLRKNGIYDDGLAYEVMQKACRGDYARVGGVDDDTLFSLLGIGFDIDFILFLEGIRYMFPKAHGVAYMMEAIAMMYYKTYFNKEYNEIMLMANEDE